MFFKWVFSYCVFYVIYCAHSLLGLFISSGIIVPGGFGVRGTEGKILAANWARIKKIPYLGDCHPRFTHSVFEKIHSMDWLIFITIYMVLEKWFYS